jgi:hypothetical protein
MCSFASSDVLFGGCFYAPTLKASEEVSFIPNAKSDKEKGIGGIGA